MIFTIDRASNDQIKPCKKAQPHSYTIPYTEYINGENGEMKGTEKETRTFLTWKIELYSLETLIDLQKEVKHHLIVKNLNDRYHITIYDDCIE